MTLILGVGNRQNVALLGDRRYTNWDGSGYSDENVKITTYQCVDARLAIGFSGLAKAPRFDTASWILDALLEASKTDWLMGPTFYRFGELASRQFRKLNVDRVLLRTTFLAIGYSYSEQEPRIYYWRISNYESVAGTTAVAKEIFDVESWREKRPMIEEPTAIVLAGETNHVDRTRLTELRDMLQQQRPIDAVVQKGVSIIRDTAARVGISGGIGQQVSAAIVPSNLTGVIGSDYDTATLSNSGYLVNCVVAAPLGSVAFKDVVIKKLSGKAPMLVPHVSRNRPCPCGSGKRYKRCHGEQRRR